MGVVGQRVTYSNGAIKTEDETTGLSHSSVKPSVRALKAAKGQPAVIVDSPGNGILCTEIINQ